MTDPASQLAEIERNLQPFKTHPSPTPWIAQDLADIVFEVCTIARNLQAELDRAHHVIQAAHELDFNDIAWCISAAEGEYGGDYTDEREQLATLKQALNAYDQHNKPA